MKRIPLMSAASVGSIAAVLAIGASTLGPAIARAERVWDIEAYDKCKDEVAGNQMDENINTQKSIEYFCCTQSGGVFIDDGYIGKCGAPPPEPASGSRQLPGNIQIPSDIATAPGVTPAPQRPIPSNIGDAPTLTTP